MKKLINRSWDGEKETAKRLEDQNSCRADRRQMGPTVFKIINFSFIRKHVIHIVRAEATLCQQMLQFAGSEFTITNG